MITYKIGDLLKDSSAMFLLHQVNCMGIMGGGIAYQIKLQNPQVNRDYIYLCNGQKEIGELLGNVQILPVDDFYSLKPQYIVNCFGQKKVSSITKMTSYDALDECFIAVKNYCEVHYPEGCVIGLPYKIGCGLGGGDWEIVEAIIRKNFAQSKSIDVEIWVLPQFKNEVTFHD
jgi:O-acetyl-ADP-ribose deacetylase (regulator of RNase III)